MLRIRTFSAANAMTVIGAAGFYGYTLVNVLFLTGVWRYSVLQAGLALSVGPVVAVVVAAPASRLARRIGPRPVLVAGGLFWGGAVLWFVGRVGVTPDFAGQWLPGMVMLGIGAGTLFPNLSGTAVASAPGESFAAATGMNSVARQVGAALGVAIVVAIIGTPTSATAYAVFHHAWAFGAVCLCVAGLGCLLVGHVKAGEEPAPGHGARGDVARAVIAEIKPRRALHSPHPRPRRVVVQDTANPAAPRAESVAEFLARTPAATARQRKHGPGSPAPRQPGDQSAYRGRRTARVRSARHGPRGRPRGGPRGARAGTEQHRRLTQNVRSARGCRRRTRSLGTTYQPKGIKSSETADAARRDRWPAP